MVVQISWFSSESLRSASWSREDILIFKDDRVAEGTSKDCKVERGLR